MKWYRLAADQNLPDAQNQLGYCYFVGRGVEKNAMEALTWFRKAADQDLPQAQHNLGFCYDSGIGVRGFRRRRSNGIAKPLSKIIFQLNITWGSAMRMATEWSRIRKNL